MRRSTGMVTIGLLVLALVMAMSLYTVDQRKAAIKFQLGEVVAVQTQPGLYFLVPVLQNVRLYDTRIQTLDARDPERFLTSENKNVKVENQDEDSDLSVSKSGSKWKSGSQSVEKYHLPRVTCAAAS